jgi:hypothetical protein
MAAFQTLLGLRTGRKPTPFITRYAARRIFRDLNPKLLGQAETTGQAGAAYPTSSLSLALTAFQRPVVSMRNGG